MARGVAMGADVRERVVALVLAGSSMRAAAREVGVPASSVRPWVVAAVDRPFAPGARGGLVEPLGPPRVKQGRFLDGEDRAVIQAGLAQGLSLAAVGRLVGRDRSVVSREVARNRGPDGVYRSGWAQRAAAARRARPKTPKLVANPALAAQVTGWLDQGWSPGLVAKVLARDHGDDQTWQVSHETIYQALYVQARGGLRKDLARRLPTGRTARKHRATTRPRGNAAALAGALTISQRPPTVADRAVPGHWEGDLIVGAGHRSAIGTLVERTTRFVVLLHLPAHNAEAVAKAMICQMSDLPAHLRRSVTWDRGWEMASWKHIQLQLRAPVYFADPHSPWQRGTNENTNRLLRFWFPKGTDLSVWTPEQIRHVQDTLNARPRPTLGLRTPAQALNDYLTSNDATTA